MKKFLLSLALMAAAAPFASAQYFKIYLSNELDNNVPVNYQLIADGDVFEAKPETQVYDWGSTLSCAAYIKVANLTASTWKAQEQSSPSFAYTVAYDKSTITAENGAYATCIGTCFTANPFYINCAASSETDAVAGSHLGYDNLFFMAGDNVDDAVIDSRYDYTVKYEDQTLNFSIVYKKEAAGIGSVSSADAPAEYFNLQGMKVSDPRQGEIYILRQGGKTSKVIR